MSDEIMWGDVVETLSRPGVECTVFREPTSRDPRYALAVGPGAGGHGRPGTIFAKRVRLVRTWAMVQAIRWAASAEHRERYGSTDAALDALGAADRYLTHARRRGADSPEAVEEMAARIAGIRQSLSRLEL